MIETAPAPKTQKNIFFAGLLFILLFIMLCVLGWVTLKLIDVERQSSLLNAQINQLQQAHATNLQIFTQQLDSQEKQLTQLQGSSQQQQAVQQVKFLLSLADLYLTVNKDPVASFHILQLASQQLAYLPANAASLKTVVINSLNKLKYTQSFDPTNLILRLDQLNGIIQNLDISTPKYSLLYKNLNAEKQTNLPKYKQMLENLSLKNWVVIHHIQQPTVPLFLPRQQVFLKENIQFKIYQAQWAILHQSNTLYQDSLKLINQWLQLYFSNDADIKKIQQDIQQMLTINISPTLPTLPISNPENTNNPAQPINKNNIKPNTKPQDANPEISI